MEEADWSVNKITSHKWIQYLVCLFDKDISIIYVKIHIQCFLTEYPKRQIEVISYNIQMQFRYEYSVYWMEYQA